MPLRIQLFLTLLIGISICNSCVIKKNNNGIHIYQKSNKLITPNGYVVAKPVKFKLKGKYNIADTSILSTNYLYFEKCWKRWFKFYDNGKVLFSSHFTPNNAAGITAMGGYYRITGRIIEIEIAYTQTSDQWANLFIEGEIQGDTLKFYKDRYSKLNSNIHHFTSSRGDPNPDCHYYILSKDSLKLKDPDW